MLLFALLISSCVTVSISLSSTHLPLSSLASENLNCSLESCPEGLFCHENLRQCRSFRNLLRCEVNGTVLSFAVLNNFCMTYDKQENALLIGGCFLSTRSHPNSQKWLPFYTVSPGQVNQGCAGMNRTGVLCGRCLLNHFPQTYSFDMNCIPCPHSHWNWLWYIMAAYLPLTLFYFFVVAFKVKIMSGYVYMAICICQGVSTPSIVREVLWYFKGSSNARSFSRLMFSLYGIWNLDFFRPYYSNLSLCLDILPTLALDYVVAVYPLLLMVVSYLLITLYDKNYRVVTAMWSPFRRLFSLFRRNWDIKTSVIDSFATFFFLSNIKFLNVSFDLLNPTEVHHLFRIHNTYSYSLYYSADMPYFGKEHIPYAALALTVTCLCVIMPLSLLALYPFRFFQRFLNLFSFRWYILHTFMDSFLGCYKDGTQPGTRDCRYFLGFLLLSHVLLYVFVGASRTGFALIPLGLIVFTLICMAVKPFKSPPPSANFSLLAYLQICTFLSAAFLAARFSISVNSEFLIVFMSLACLAACVPLIDAARVLFVLVVRRRRGIYHCVMACCMRCDPSDEYEELAGGCGEGGEGLSDFGSRS